MLDSAINACLLIFSGLPASGKSTLAKAAARELRAMYLRIDTIEQALRDFCDVDVEGEGYRLAYRVASDNLRLGISVVSDSCNPIDLTRDEWESVAGGAGSAFVNIEVCCSDRTEHRRRVESRAAEVSGLQLPTWREVQQRRYEEWTRERLVIDTAGRSVAESEDELFRHLRSRGVMA